MTQRNHSDRLTIAAEQNIKERNFWLDRLSGSLIKSHFPYDHKITGENKRVIDSIDFVFSDELHAKFMELSKGSNYTLNLIFVAGLMLLLEKYTGRNDIMVGTPIYKQQMEGEFINTVLVLREVIESHLAFREFLLRVRQSIKEAVENQNYPLEILVKELDVEDQEGDFPLIDVAILLENIHPKEYLQHLGCSVVFVLNRTDRSIEGIVEYDSLLYEKNTIERIVSHFIHVFQAALFDVNVPTSAIEIIAGEEKEQLLFAFNRTTAGYPEDKSIHQLFAEQVEKTPDKTAVCSPLDLTDIYDLLESERVTVTPVLKEKMESCCFKKNAFIYQGNLHLPGKRGNLNVLKTHRHNSVIVNNNMAKCIDLFDGERNLKSIYSLVQETENSEFLVYSMSWNDLLEVTFQFNRNPERFSFGSNSGNGFEDFVRLVQVLYREHLIELQGMSGESSLPMAVGFDIEDHESFSGDILPEDLLTGDKEPTKARVLLLGDTPGTATTGLLYLGAYLERNGINACCQFYDPTRDYASMKKNILALLEKIQPAVVAVSMKWFLYMARVIDICTIIKEYAAENSLDIDVVLGGNTASYYWKELITYDCIDYLVRGDGEEPLLKICNGEEISSIPNCIYKRDGEIVENPMAYVQDETNSQDIYLSHLDKLLLSDHASLFGSFFIYTLKGCAMNCLYCGGCNRAQQKAFGRKFVFKRGVREVRRDIKEARKYTSTFQFEFDILDKDLPDYCRRIWEGIDLSGHFCIFSTLTPPSDALIEEVSRRFKYVYWDYDVCTLSQRHREQLFSLGLVKPQPRDEEILDFLARCEKYENIEVRLNLITGLPHFTMEDIEPGERLLSKIMNTYSSFGELHWARLHAQPGAPILENPEAYGMHSYASTFEDFLKYSRESFNKDSRSGYSTVENFSYPYIYFNDDRLNSDVTKFYMENNRKVHQHRNDKQRGLIVCDTLTYRELNEQADRLSGILRTKGVRPGGVVGLMLERSIMIPVGILGIQKAGCAYMPIDPEFPTGRIEYMLGDSNAAALVTNRELFEEGDNVKIWEGDTIFMGVGDRLDGDESSHHSSSGIHHFDIAYVIYTSGTTGKPKGVLLTHNNLVNYVHWFSTTASLTSEDKTALTSSFAFDLGYTSLYTALLKGGELHILPRDIYLLPERFLDYIKQRGITYIKVTPSLFSVIINTPGFSGDTCSSLRIAAVGGEAVNVDDIEKAHSLCSHLQIMNHYGPTEATIGCAATFIDFNEFEGYKAHPVIGKPVHNTHIYILGKDLTLLPVGVPGELCVSGTCLAAGYLNRPGLTAEKFINRMPYQRIYKTGDLARWLPNGTIEFLGRIDKQVKIKGYRIELGEIENRLRRHPKVEDALVIAKEKYICAYVVSSEEQRVSPEVGKEIPDQKKVVPFKEIDLTRFAEEVRKSPGKIAVKSGIDGESSTYRSLDRNSARVARFIRNNYDDRYKLSKSERVRYKRQLLLYGWGPASQEKLKGTTVFVAGAGGGASPTIVQLALTGFGTIKVCDFDVVELSNLNRQFLHDETRIGMNKALSAKMTIERINPNVRVIPIQEKLTGDNVFELVGDSAIIFDMFDGPADKFILSQCAVVKQIPHIIISMADINAYTAVFHTPYTPCYHCIFDRQKLEAITRGMKSFVENYSKNPLAVASSSLFISTGTAVNEGLKILLGFDVPAYNKFFYFNQRGATENLANTASYRSMTSLFSDHFMRICRDQGFDWDKGWRGNFLEELPIQPDPQCLLCSEEGKLRRKALEDQREKASSSVDIKVKTEVKKEVDPVRSVALLFDPGIPLAAAIMGVLKSGKTYVPLTPHASIEQLSYILEDSESRIILTDTGHMDLAEKLKDRVNRNIKVMSMEVIEDEESGELDETVDIKTESPQAAYMLYTSNSGSGFEGLNRAAAEYCNAMGSGVVYTFAVEREKPGPISFDRDLREYLREELPDYMIPSHFVRLDRMPLTPNGKIDRKALPDPVTGVEEADTYTAPENEMEAELEKIWSEVLGVERIGMDISFFQLGLDSIKALQAAARMSQKGLKLDMNDIFSNPTIRQLSRTVTFSDRTIEQGVIEGEVKLTAIQKWFFENYFEERHYFNMAVMLYREQGIDEEFVRKAFGKIAAHHDALRMVYEFRQDEIIQRNRNLDGDLFDLEVIRVDKDESMEEKIGKEADRIQQSIDLESGPLVKLGLFKTSKGDHLLIVIHHLVMDGLSWRIIFEDIEILFQQDNKGETFMLPPKSDSFKRWAEQLAQYADSESFLQERDFWVGMEAGAAKVPRLPRDFEEESYLKDSMTLFFDLSAEETRQLLTETNKAFGTEINDILLTALGLVFKKVYGHRYLLIAMEGHGREQILEDMDISRTVGFFTSQYPVLLDISYENDLSRQIVEVKETLHRLPNKGVGYGILKYLTADRNKEGIEFKLHPRISFNYLGQFDSEVKQMASFGMSNMPTGNSQGVDVKQPYDLDISGMIANKRLNMSIRFSNKQYKQETVKTLLDRYEAELRDIISFCSSREDAEVTPSDFTYKGLSVDQLDQLFD